MALMSMRVTLAGLALTLALHLPAVAQQGGGDLRADPAPQAQETVESAPLAQESVDSAPLAQTTGAAPSSETQPASSESLAQPVVGPDAPAIAAGNAPAGISGQPAETPLAPVDPARTAAERASPAAPQVEVQAESQAAPQVEAQAESQAAPVDPFSAELAAALEAAVREMLDAPVARAAPGQTPAAAFRRERQAIAALYEERAFAPIWIEGAAFTPAARAALARIQRHRDDGLDLSQYPAPTLSEVGRDAARLAAAELALSLSVVAYARQASGGRINPRAISTLITVRPEVADAAQVLRDVSAAPDADAALLAYNPPHPGYAALRDKLSQLRHERPAMARQRISPGPVLRVGMTDPRVPLVRARFGLDAMAAQEGAELLYDTRVASAVADFQRANGLPANGQLTGRTIAALSGGDPADLEGEILANMERWRWAPRDMGETRVEVNIPDFHMRVVRAGKEVHRARVIVGKPQTQTPVFSDQISFMVVNPSWHVPQSIVRKEMLPAWRNDPSYFARRGYEVVQRGNTIHVRQPPGEKNALGLIKFMFPNEHAVYLHDTPTRHLFNSARRAYSHGCVRVDQPFRLAEVLLEPEENWSPSRLRGLVGSRERTLRMQEKVPVHLMYFTTFVDAEGRIQMRADLYGHSRKVRAALGV
jgi:murein L,D-transpeptidase YcbB/YkuD